MLTIPKPTYMKQFYILALVGLLGISATAQKACAPKQPVRTQFNESKTFAPAASGDRVIVWANTISDCDEWAPGSASDPGVDLEWQCGPSLAPTGAYAIAGIESTTSEDGVLMLDSDAAGEAVGPTENCWMDLTVPFSTIGNSSIALTFYNYFRTYQPESEYCLLEVSRDGVTWPDVSTTEETDGFVVYNTTDTVQSRWDLFQGLSNGDATANPAMKTVNISGVAGNQAEVYLRFRWVGSWGYAWMVDDLEVSEIPAYDVTISDYTSNTNSSISNLYEYGVWPESQLPDTLVYACEVLNFGDSLASNVFATVDVSGPAGGETMFTGASIPALASGETDTLYVAYAPGTALGDVSLDLSIAMDSTDANMLNNNVGSDFEVSAYQWGRDDGVIRGLNSAEGEEDYIEMPLYQVLEDVTIYGIDVAIMEGSTAFSPVQGHLIDIDDPDALNEQYGGVLTSSPEVELVSSNFNDDDGEITWYTLAFEDPYNAVEGDFLGAAFESFGGAPVFVARAQPVPSQTVFVYGPYGEGQAYDWYYQTSTPMVRLNLNPDAVTNTLDVLSLEGFKLSPAFPNPTTDATRFRFQLERSAEVTFELRDIAGKLVERRDLGTQPAGMGNMVLETSAFGAGSYTATFVVDGACTTQKLMIK